MRIKRQQNSRRKRTRKTSLHPFSLSFSLSLIPQRDANTKGYGGVHQSDMIERVISSRVTYKRDLHISRKHFDFLYSKGFDTQQISTPTVHERGGGEGGKGQKGWNYVISRSHLSVPFCLTQISGNFRGLIMQKATLHERRLCANTA